MDTAGDGTDCDERPAGTDIVIEVTGGVSYRLSRSPVIVSFRIVFKMAVPCSRVCNDVMASRLYP